jgi:predicted nucleic acid-binding protein
VTRYVIDTNLYIDATHVAVAADELQAFYASFLPFVHLHSVVAQEVLLGAVDPDDEREVRESLIAPFEDVGRVITPSHSTWKRASGIMLELIRRKSITHQEVHRSFASDCLLAASARERGFVLVTNNARDFERIREVEPFHFVRPWPERPSG